MRQARLNSNTTVPAAMTKVLGKRKARSAEDKTALDPENAQEIFRRHFETQFKPLAVEPIRPLPPTVEAEDDEDPGSEAEDSEWGGISEDEDDGTATH